CLVLPRWLRLHDPQTCNTVTGACRALGAWQLESEVLASGSAHDIHDQLPNHPWHFATGLRQQKFEAIRSRWGAGGFASQIDDVLFHHVTFLIREAVKHAR